MFCTKTQIKILNLSQLEEGTYSIEIGGGKKRFTRQIKVKTITPTLQKPRTIEVSE